MTLHCVNGNVDSDLLDRLLAWIESEDAVLLLGPAANIARSSHPALPALLSKGNKLYALEDDLALYGVSSRDLRVEAVDYGAFVALSVAQRRQLLWR